jgi:phosphohistidine swiveling domain-containing protein
MELVRDFKRLSKHDVAIAGGKGASLGEMTQAGIPVPPGYVILSDSFERFIEETEIVSDIDAILHKVNHKDINSVERASQEIQGIILSEAIPKDIEKEIKSHFKKLDAKFVAVRSSATSEDSASAAWAGQLDTYLNTTEDKLLENVKKCWASLFTPRAIFYRFEKNLHEHKISVAVVVQKMVESEVSGIAFSVHPVTQDRNQMIIEAGFGLGEAIVSGQITPDSYVTEKDSLEIIEKNISEQERGIFRAAKGGDEWRNISNGAEQKISDKEVVELSKLIMRIEKHYGFPCDIEWAQEKKKFYIVQSRPITTLAQEVEGAVKKNTIEFVSPALKGFNPDDYKFIGLWKNDLFATCFWQDAWVPDLVKKLGVKSDGIWALNLYGGHYFLSKAEIKNIHDQLSKKIEKKDESFFKNMVKVADSEFISGVKTGESLRTKEPTLENFRKFVAAAKRINLLWQLGADRFVVVTEEKLQEAVVKEHFPAEHVLEIVPKVITPIYYHNKELVQLKKLIGKKSFKDVMKDKKLSKNVKDHADKYPWIEVFNFVGESLTPERLYEQIEHMEDVKESPKYVPEKPISSELAFRARCMYYCGYIKQAGAEYFSIFSERVLPFLNGVAKKIGVTHGEFIALTIEEIEKGLMKELATSELKKRAKKRLGVNNWILVGEKDGRSIFVEEPSDVKLLKEVMIPVADKNAKEIKGDIGNKGKYVGPVRVIMNTHDFSKMKAGDVLVSTMTTPDFVILMQKSGAIVTDIGGLLCHAAIVSREINKPCIIGTRFATQILKDGDIVEVDANKGVVRKL